MLSNLNCSLNCFKELIFEKFVCISIIICWIMRKIQKARFLVEKPLGMPGDGGGWLELIFKILSVS